MFKCLPLFVRVWFLLNLGLALFPPVHWAVSGPAEVAGLPAALVYIYALSLSTAASVVVAYFADQGEA